MMLAGHLSVYIISSRRRHTRSYGDWSSDVCSSDLVVMGIGMALLEHTSYDAQNGAPINSNLADYVVAVNADAPPIEVYFLDYPDKEINEVGARGIGEIGLRSEERRVGKEWRCRWAR